MLHTTRVWVRLQLYSVKTIDTQKFGFILLKSWTVLQGWCTNATKHLHQLHGVTINERTLFYVLHWLLSSPVVLLAQLTASSSHLSFCNETRLKCLECYYSPCLLCQNESDEYRLNFSVSFFMLHVCMGTGDLLQE